MLFPAFRRNAGLLVVATCLQGLAGSPATAQSECEAGLQAAAKSYELGLFEDVPGQVAPCLQRSASRSELVRAQVLLAKSYLASDQLENAREAVAELLRVDPGHEPEPPPQLARLIEEIRRRESELQVETVSKTSENLREAPATVVVIRAEEIEQRGYLDLEEILHDLPGFNISRGNGETYSNFYQRGFRSKDNDRILLLVDGVEQNDLTTSVAHLSRQYPVSSVDRIEVVYGPAATMYGANAYSGVINIITKSPEAFVPAGKRHGLLLQAAGGSFGTRSIDLALAGHDAADSTAWSVTGRLFRSDELDLSRFPGWRYDFGAVPYRDLLRFEGEDAEEFCSRFEQPGYCGEDLYGPEPPFTVTYDEEGVARAVALTDAGARLARGLDQRIRIKFSDPTEDWSLYAKLRLGSVTVGVQAWGLEEGTAPWHNGNAYAELAPASWAPEQMSLFVKHGRSLGKNLSLNLFTRYRQSDLDPRRSQRISISSYANGDLDLGDLVYGCNPDSPAAPCVPSTESIAVPRRLSTQAAAELTLVYSPDRRLTLVSGLDLTKGSIQTREVPFRSGFGAVDQLVDHSDAGLYTQATYKPLPVLSLVAGGRVDYNQASSPEFPDSGFGTLFSPRLALIYFPRRYAVKLIYAEAFKDPSDFEKFSAEEDERLPNPDLQPERTQSLELVGGWYPGGGTSLELSAYRTRYHDIVAVGATCLPSDAGPAAPTAFPCPSLNPPPDAPYAVFNQLQNILDLEVTGFELRAAARIGKLPLFGNLTYTDPKGTGPDQAGRLSTVRLGDIASYTANLGVRLPLWQRADVSLRWNYVDARRTGQGTSVPTNPLTSIDGYSVANAAFTYRDVLPGTSVQLIVNNLFDRAYADPGVLTADGFHFAARVPQPGRTVYLRLTWGLGSRASDPGRGDTGEPSNP